MQRVRLTVKKTRHTNLDFVHILNDCKGLYITYIFWSAGVFIFACSGYVLFGPDVFQGLVWDKTSWSIWMVFPGRVSRSGRSWMVTQVTHMLCGGTAGHPQVDSTCQPSNCEESTGHRDVFWGQNQMSPCTIHLEKKKTSGFGVANVSWCPVVWCKWFASCWFARVLCH